MLELSMTAASCDNVPPVIAKKSQDLTDFHRASISVRYDADQLLNFRCGITSAMTRTSKEPRRKRRGFQNLNT
jgi:hypothetical protein